MKGKISQIPLKINAHEHRILTRAVRRSCRTNSIIITISLRSPEVYGNQGTYVNIIVLLDCDLQCIRQTAPQETPTETGVLWNKKRSYPQLDREFPISCRTQQVIIEGRLLTTEDVHALSGVIQGI